MRRDFFSRRFCSWCYFGYFFLFIQFGLLPRPRFFSPAGLSKLIPVYIVFPFGPCSCTYSKPEKLSRQNGAIQFLGSNYLTDKITTNQLVKKKSSSPLHLVIMDSSPAFTLSEHYRIQNVDYGTYLEMEQTGPQLVLRPHKAYSENQQVCIGVKSNKTSQKVK